MAVVVSDNVEIIIVENVECPDCYAILNYHRQPHRCPSADINCEDEGFVDKIELTSEPYFKCPECNQRLNYVKQYHNCHKFGDSRSDTDQGFIDRPVLQQKILVEA
jgi:hypothetical protein